MFLVDLYVSVLIVTAFFATGFTVIATFIFMITFLYIAKIGLSKNNVF